MAQASNADPTRWAQFYLEHRTTLAAYALTLVGNAAEAQDLIQDVLVRMVAEQRPATDARAYVFRCLRNRAIDRRRRAARAPATAALEGAGAVIDSRAASAEQRELAQQVQAALQCLPPEYREVIVLKVYGALTFREIAEVLGVPLGTAASHYRRGLEEMRTLLSEVPDDVS